MNFVVFLIARSRFFLLGCMLWHDLDVLVFNLYSASFINYTLKFQQECF